MWDIDFIWGRCTVQMLQLCPKQNAGSLYHVCNMEYNMQSSTLKLKGVRIYMLVQFADDSFNSTKCLIKYYTVIQISPKQHWSRYNLIKTNDKPWHELVLAHITHIYMYAGQPMLTGHVVGDYANKAQQQTTHNMFASDDIDMYCISMA